MIEGMTLFMPLTHSYLKRVLQIYMQTSDIEHNNFHESDYEIHFLLASAFI